MTGERGPLTFHHHSEEQSLETRSGVQRLKPNVDPLQWHRPAVFNLKSWKERLCHHASWLIMCHLYTVQSMSLAKDFNEASVKMSPSWHALVLSGHVFLFLFSLPFASIHLSPQHLLVPQFLFFHPFLTGLSMIFHTLCQCLMAHR